MSRPLLMSISLFLVSTSILCCNQFPPSNLYSRSRPHVALFLAACSPNCLKVVATWISSAQFFFKSRHRLWSLINKWSQLQFLGKDFVWLLFRLQPLFCSSTLNLVATLIFLLRLQFPLSCRDLNGMSRPQLYSIGVATSEWCRDRIFYFEYFL